MANKPSQSLENLPLNQTTTRLPIRERSKMPASALGSGPMSISNGSESSDGSSDGRLSPAVHDESESATAEGEGGVESAMPFPPPTLAEETRCQHAERSNDAAEGRGALRDLLNRFRALPAWLRAFDNVPAEVESELYPLSIRNTPEDTMEGGYLAELSEELGRIEAQMAAGEFENAYMALKTTGEFFDFVKRRVASMQAAMRFVEEMAEEEAQMQADRASMRTGFQW